MADKRNQSSSRRSRGARILCLILVVLMLLGSASTVILFLFAYKTSAADYAEPVMSIGIQYGTSATGSFRTYSDTGYTLLEQAPDGERKAVPLGNITDKTLVVAPHANLAYSGTGFAAVSSGAAIGGYRIDLATDYADFSEAASAAESLSKSLSSKGYQAFPAYLAGECKVRVGCFVSAEDAQTAKSALSAEVGEDAVVSSPSSYAVSVLTTAGQIKAEFENGTATYLGLRPGGSGDVYMRADNNYIYEGAFMYKRSGDLITVINMIGLETYIEGVLPYEISSSWHIEAQKAFSIAARSYAMGNRGKHYKSYGFDLCCTTDCQVYRGAGGVTDTVKSAVAATAGEILMYKGKVATLYYSSSTGGCTVSAKDCWGGDGAPYLTAVSTPWERYADYSNGLWTVEVSPTELCEYLRGKGYTALTGSIAQISVEARATDSDYVKSLKITDTSGNSVTINNTDKVRTSLSKYLKSANFNVGRGNVAYTVAKVTATTETLPYHSQSMSSFNVMTAIGKVFAELSSAPTVATGKGNFTVAEDYEYVITADSHNGGGDVITGGFKTEYSDKVATASSADNFIFAGKGWGHGVGLSQYGTKDLAEFGYSYEKILAAYVPAATLKTVSDLG